MPQPPNSNRPQVNRILIGIISITCFVLAFVVAYNDTWENFWCGSFVRVGLLMGAFWIAAPTKGRAAAWANVSPWTIVGVASLMLFIVRRPRIFIPFFIALVVLGYLIPKLTGQRKPPR